MWIADAAHCREVDRRASADFGIASEALMARAGAAVFHVVLAMLPARRRLAVVCGKGNNGGDGLVVARLAKLQGLDVGCFVVAREDDLSADARRELERADEAGVQPAFDSPASAELASYDLIVDALLGTGADRPVSGELQSAIAAINGSGTPVVSVDVPSGVACDTGRVLGAAVRAHRTVTFGFPKRCFFQGEGMELAGEWSVADIGYPAALVSTPTGATLVERDVVARLMPVRRRGSHKGDNGRVLIVAGSRRMPGATTLAALGALRAGAGLVTVAAIDSVCGAVASLLPEATLLPLPEADGAIAPAAAEVLGDRLSDFDAVAVGPGLTQDPALLEFLRGFFRTKLPPACIDADALNAVGQGVELPASPCVLTPHPGEMGRLLGCSTDQVQADRFKAASEASARFGGACLLKGAHTLTAAEGKPIAANPTGNAGMATGGMGDVLTGVVATLLAQGLDPYDAAVAAAFWHGLAGDLAGAPGFGPRDLAAKLPEARAKILSA